MPVKFIVPPLLTIVVVPTVSAPVPNIKLPETDKVPVENAPPTGVKVLPAPIVVSPEIVRAFVLLLSVAVPARVRVVAAASAPAIVTLKLVIVTVSAPTGVTPPQLVHVLATFQAVEAIAVHAFAYAWLTETKLNKAKEKIVIPTERKTFFKVNFIFFYTPPGRDKLIINN